MSMECEISLSNSDDTKNDEKGHSFKVLEEGAVQVFVLYMLFFRNQYLDPLERKKKDRLQLMD